MLFMLFVMWILTLVAGEHLKDPAINDWLYLMPAFVSFVIMVIYVSWLEGKVYKK